MRHAFAAVLIALSLAAAPVQAKGPADFVTSIPHDFVTGARFYFTTVGGWFTSLLDLLGLRERLAIVDEGEACAQGARCSLGLVCVNVCDGADCDVYAKRCLKGPERVNILGEYSICGAGDLCAGETFCARTCPAGADCGGETHRCMRVIEPGVACTVASDCRSACAKHPFAPIGPSAYLAACVEGACTCSTVEIEPAAARVECPAGASDEIVCPAGTHAACTAAAACPSGACPPYLTCLNAPAYGGACIDDGECTDAACSEGASPFCDPNDRICKCRSSEIKTIACAAASDCAAAACGTNEIPACVQGACACAPAGVVTSCASASECSSDCPEGYGAACVEGQCACQRVTENVPVACESVDQCGGVSCPGGFDKACIDAKCACTRTVQQE